MENLNTCITMQLLSPEINWNAFHQPSRSQSYFKNKFAIKWPFEIFNSGVDGIYYGGYDTADSFTLW